ncbi:hypothetical protein QAD02_006140 [Eretmocerus hayati]|uniref:Uncharacterized protein n=1 Tax=Eretmocerus hayati TaxID=131215 RepID=A0ACC2N068_9HYME|nr:hypothetical protein QAD02_006140 [Eretmocerus hayati]
MAYNSDGDEIDLRNFDSQQYSIFTTPVSDKIGKDGYFVSTAISGAITSSGGFRPDVKGESDFRWALGINYFSLDLIGVWTHENASSDTLVPRKFRIPLMIGVATLGIVLPQGYALYLVSSHLPLVLDNLCTSAACTIGLVKLLYLWKYRHDLTEVMEEARNDWLRNKTSWERSVMLKQAGRARSFTIVGYCVMLMALLNYGVPPFFGYTSRMVNNITDTGSELGHYFPLQAAFPFESDITPNFQILYFLMWISMLCDVTAYTFPDNLFGALIFHASAQAEILGAQMRHAFDGFEGTRSGNEGFIQSKIKQIAINQVRLRRLMRLTNDSFKTIILSQVVSLTIATCSFGFGTIDALSNDKDDIPMMRLLIAGEATLASMFQILIYCVASEVYIHHSEMHVNNMYASKWYDVSITDSRDIILVMAVSQTSPRPTAGGFVDLSLNLFVQICRTTFSYISVLLAASK